MRQGCGPESRQHEPKDENLECDIEPDSENQVRRSVTEWMRSSYWIGTLGLVAILLVLLIVLVMKRQQQSQNLTPKEKMVDVTLEDTRPPEQKMLETVCQTSTEHAAKNKTETNVLTQASSETMLDSEASPKESVLTRFARGFEKSVCAGWGKFYKNLQQAELRQEQTEPPVVVESLRLQEDGYSVPVRREQRKALRLAQHDGELSLTLPHGLSMRLRKVSSGNFIMGSDEDDEGRGNHEEEHGVILDGAFWLGEHEVSRGEWKAVMGCVNASRTEGDEIPMVFVNRAEALAFCSVLNDLYGRKLPPGHIFCLPTCAQWEYASRGGRESRGFRYSGSDCLDDVAWYAGNSDKHLHGVGRKTPNELGFYDMSGNAQEYCLDNASNLAQETNPIGDIWSIRYGVRGGGYHSPAEQCRVSSLTFYQGRHGRYGTVGFRVALVPMREFALKNTTEEASPQKTETMRPQDEQGSASKTNPDAVKKGDSRPDEKKQADKGKEGGTEKKRRRRSNVQLLRTRREILEDEKKKPEEAEGKEDGKRKQRPKFQLLHTRQELQERLAETSEREPQGTERNKDGEKKRHRPRFQLLHTRQEMRDLVNGDTGIGGRRKLLQTRAEVEEAREMGRRTKAPGKNSFLSGDEAVLKVGKEAELVLVRVKAGKRILGSAPEEPERSQDEILRKYQLRGRIWMGKFEVSQELYAAVMKENPSLIRGNDQRPVENVTWEEAVEFCQRLTDFFKDKLPEGMVFRLPTEDEWEFCSRGGTNAKACRYSGDDALENVGWFVANASGTTHGIGLLKANELGLHDFSGNVSEWCLDSCDRNDYGEVTEARRRRRKGLTYRIRRGGAWCFRAADCRSASRRCSLPDFRSPYVGFRVALGDVQE